MCPSTELQELVSVPSRPTKIAQLNKEKDVDLEFWSVLMENEKQGSGKTGQPEHVL